MNCILIYPSFLQPFVLCIIIHNSLHTWRCYSWLCTLRLPLELCLCSINPGNNCIDNWSLSQNCLSFYVWQHCHKKVCWCCSGAMLGSSRPSADLWLPNHPALHNAAHGGEEQVCNLGDCSYRRVHSCDNVRALRSNTLFVLAAQA